MNCLLYLNHDWKLEYGGELILGKPDEEQEIIVPVFNRLVIFTTSETSWHGHPNPVAAGHIRRSVAMYYYTDEAPATSGSPHSTIWSE